MAQLSNNSAGAELTQRDANHAAKTFTSEPGYTNAPYSGFLFHVNVVFNNVAPSSIDKKTVSMLIKASDLPEVQFETETYNQYNRKRIVNKRVIYQPIKLTFHDDVANNVRNMWIAYNQHYNADSAHITNAAWKYDNVYRSEGFDRAYGLDVNTVTPFLDKIEIHSMGNHRYSKMTLVNPIINSAAFDDHNYSEGAKIMETTFNVEYENIIYSTGGTDQISNFGKNNPEHYDLNASPLGVDRTSFLEALLDTPINIADLLGSFIKDQVGIDTQAGRVRGNNNNGSAYDIIKSATSGSSNNNNNGQFVFPEVPAVVETNTTVATQGGAITGSSNSTSNGGNVSTIITPAVTADTPVSELTETQQTDASINVTDVGRNPTSSAMSAYLNSAIPNSNFIITQVQQPVTNGKVFLDLQTSQISKSSTNTLINQIISSLANSGMPEISVTTRDTNGKFLENKTYNYPLANTIKNRLSNNVSISHQVIEVQQPLTNGKVFLELQTSQTSGPSVNTLLNQTISSLANSGIPEISVTVRDTNGKYIRNATNIY